jgi:hypothetical protein
MAIVAHERVVPCSCMRSIAKVDFSILAARSYLAARVLLQMASREAQQ